MALSGPHLTKAVRERTDPGSSRHARHTRVSGVGDLEV